MTDSFADLPDLEPTPDWMQVTIQAPPEVGEHILMVLRTLHRFNEVDWCVMGRDEDNARVDYAPCPPLTRKPLD